MNAAHSSAVCSDKAVNFGICSCEKYVQCFCGSRKPMWSTSSKRTFMERFWVSSWWATSVQRGHTTRLVRLPLANIEAAVSQIKCFCHSSIFHRSLLFCASVLTEALIAAINNDIEEAKVKLELPEHLKLRDDNFFTSTAGSSSVSPTTASTSQTIMNGHWQLAGTALLCSCTHTDQDDSFCIHRGLFTCTTSFSSLYNWARTESKTTNHFLLCFSFYCVSVSVLKGF